MLQFTRNKYLFEEVIMLKSFLIYLSKAIWAQQIVTKWSFARNAASRFIAGEYIKNAIDTARELNKIGINATIDHLGESTATEEDAVRAANDIKHLLDEIGCCDIRANVSLKLTQIGLSINIELCKQNLISILDCATKNKNYIRIDMEDTPYTDQTISLYRFLRSKGYENVGIVIQSYLYRSEDDINELIKEGARFRLVKGAYKEPAEVAFPRKKDVDQNFDKLTRLMLDASSQLPNLSGLSPDGRTPPLPAIGTHDPNRIDFAKQYAMSIGLQKDMLEFQMLYGIRRDLQESCVKDGFPVRVYVPYGTHWYPFYMRRLAERPANLLFFIGNYFRK